METRTDQNVNGPEYCMDGAVVEFVWRNYGFDVYWVMDTFDAVETTSDGSNVRYQYDTGSGWNGVWLSKAEMRWQSAPLSKKFRVKAQLNSDGWTPCGVDDLSIETSSDMPTPKSGVPDGHWSLYE